MNCSLAKVGMFLAIFSLLLLAAAVGAQNGSKDPPARAVNPPPASLQRMILLPSTPEVGKAPPRMFGDINPEEPPWMQFSIDWTTCQFHRVDDTPLEAILSGTIDGSNPLFWNLSTSEPQPGAPPLLYYVENIFGNANPVLGTDIPLTWEISLDGGAFVPMTLLPDNTLTTTFPPGQHAFQVRITGTPQNYQADGYYHLQLTQCLVPEL